MELLDRKMIHQSMQILGGIRLSLIGGSARRPTVTAPVVCEHAIPRPGKRRNLVDPHRGAAGAWVREDDRDTGAAGVLVPKSNARKVGDHSVVF
jgi:hypothetical protein